MTSQVSPTHLMHSQWWLFVALYFSNFLLIKIDHLDKGKTDENDECIDQLLNLRADSYLQWSEYVGRTVLQINKFWTH